MSPARIAALLATLGSWAGSAPAQTAPGPRSRWTPIVEVVREVGPTVVNLYANVDFERRTFFGERVLSEASSLGSGVIVHPSGLVVTNTHVVTAMLGERFNIQDIEITVSYRPDWSRQGASTGQRFRARLLGFDRQNDLALLRIEDERTFPSAVLGTSSDLMIGETVVALGNPLGREGSVTHGIISALDRQLPAPGGPGIADLIQTDAPLNPGNSGGPLFNIRGELIGINQAIGADARTGRAEGQGLAIPVDRVRRILEDFNPYELGRFYLGLQVDSDRSGTHVVGVDRQGPAARAGMRRGDHIVEVGDYPVPDALSFNLALFSFEPGARVPVTLERDGERSRLTLAPLEVASTVEQRLGARLEMDSSLPGPRVDSIRSRGPFATLGVRRDDIILELGGQRTRSVQDLFEVLLASEPGEKLGIVVRRYRRVGRQRTFDDYEGELTP